MKKFITVMKKVKDSPHIYALFYDESANRFFVDYRYVNYHDICKYKLITMSLINIK